MHLKLKNNYNLKIDAKETDNNVAQHVWHILYINDIDIFTKHVDFTNNFKGQQSLQLTSQVTSQLTSLDYTFTLYQWDITDITLAHGWWADYRWLADVVGSYAEHEDHHKKPKYISLLYYLSEIFSNYLRMAQIPTTHNISVYYDVL